MMVMRAAIIAAAAALLVAGSAGAAGSRILRQGPLFAGTAVLWGEQADTMPSLRRWTARGGEQSIFAGDTRPPCLRRATNIS